MTRLTALLTVAAIGCEARPPSFRLDFSSPGVSSSDGGPATLKMEAGQIVSIVLLAVGSVSGPVSFKGVDLPGFATLDGAVLKLAPARSEAGRYLLQVTASDGDESRTAPLDLEVQRSNSPPSLHPMVGFSDDTGFRQLVPNQCPDPAICTASGTAKLGVSVCDEDGDSVTADVEVVPRGTPFAGVPSYSVSERTRRGSTGLGSPCASMEVALAGLQPQQSYDFAIRVTDEFGAVAPVAYENFVTSIPGWNHLSKWGFDQGPCSTKQCACSRSGSFCFNNIDCCSGTCMPPSPGLVGHCQ